jgi:hypothetical protein
MKIVIPSLLSLVALEATTAHRLGGPPRGGRGGPPRGGIFGSPEGEGVEFVDLGCSDLDQNLVTCTLPPRKRHHHRSSDDEEDGEDAPKEGIFVCRAVPKPPEDMFDTEDEDGSPELIDVSFCIPDTRAIEGDTCGCCGDDCFPCSCACDKTLRNGTVIEDFGVSVLIDTDEFQGEKCVPSSKAITIIEMFDGAASCKTDCQ